MKVAARTNSLKDLATLIGLLEKQGNPQLSVMGMGPYGKISRLLFARAGSVLNYGYLEQPQVPGQWEATVLKQRLSEVEED